jgi:hypothetical protein
MRLGQLVKGVSYKVPIAGNQIGGLLHTRLACSQDGSHAREEEANLSAVLAV